MAAPLLPFTFGFGILLGDVCSIDCNSGSSSTPSFDSCPLINSSMRIALATALVFGFGSIHFSGEGGEGVSGEGCEGVSGKGCEGVSGEGCEGVSGSGVIVELVGVWGRAMLMGVGVSGAGCTGIGVTGVMGVVPEMPNNTANASNAGSKTSVGFG